MNIFNTAPRWNPFNAHIGARFPSANTFSRYLFLKDHFENDKAAKGAGLETRQIDYQDALKAAIKTRNFGHLLKQDIGLWQAAIEDPQLDVHQWVRIKDIHGVYRGPLLIAVCDANRWDIVDLILNSPKFEVNFKYECGSLLEMLCIVAENKELTLEQSSAPSFFQKPRYQLIEKLLLIPGIHISGLALDLISNFSKEMGQPIWEAMSRAFAGELQEEPSNIEKRANALELYFEEVMEMEDILKPKQAVSSLEFNAAIRAFKAQFGIQRVQAIFHADIAYKEALQHAFFSNPEIAGYLLQHKDPINELGQVVYDSKYTKKLLKAMRYGGMKIPFISKEDKERGIIEGGLIKVMNQPLRDEVVLHANEVENVCMHSDMVEFSRLCGILADTLEEGGPFEQYYLYQMEFPDHAVAGVAVIDTENAKICAFLFMNSWKRKSYTQEHTEGPLKKLKELNYLSDNFQLIDCSHRIQTNEEDGNCVFYSIEFLKAFINAYKDGLLESIDWKDPNLDKDFVAATVRRALKIKLPQYYYDRGKARYKREKEYGKYGKMQAIVSRVREFLSPEVDLDPEDYYPRSWQELRRVHYAAKFELQRMPIEDKYQDALEYIENLIWAEF